MKIKATAVLFALLFCSVLCHAQPFDITYYNMTIKDGMSSNQVQCIYKDSRGFLWVGSMLGLNRYDGFRFRTFYFQANNKQSLLDNNVMEMFEDADRHLWVKTAMGYCIYDAEHEVFDANVRAWMTAHGMQGKPFIATADDNHNLWICTDNMDCFFYDFARKKALHFRHGGGKGQLPEGVISAITTVDRFAVVTYNNGTLAKLDSKTGRVLWINNYIPQHGYDKQQYYRTFVDKQNNYWVYMRSKTLKYVFATHEWMVYPINMVTDILQDRQGRIWLATDHNGVIVDGKPLIVNVPDKTIRCLYLDNIGTVWIGTYKCGLTYHYEGQTLFPRLAVGDICTITQDALGNLWCGTNDKGIVSVSSSNQSQTTYNAATTHLGSDIIVCSLTASDGSLWFGTFLGGLLRIRNGQFTVWRKSSSDLSSDNIWALSEDSQGNIVIGTLDAGMQVLDPNSGQFTTYNYKNSGLYSDYVSSMCTDSNGEIVIGHSQGISFFDTKQRKIRNWSKTRSGQQLSSYSINQVFVDSRQLLWILTSAGLNVYDRAADSISYVSTNALMDERDVCAITEDREGAIWVTTPYNVKRIHVNTQNGGLQFFVNSFSSFDGLQSGLFNHRSIYTTDKGDIVVGGMEGINIISPQLIHKQTDFSAVIFSGLLIFDHVVSVGEELNGSTILKASLNDSRRLSLDHWVNAFTIQLASTNAGIPEHSRFQYRLVGLNDRWQYTTENKPSISFTSLNSGTYQLEVRIVNQNGTSESPVSTLTIVINPPFYLTWWAFLFYILLLAAIVYLLFHSYKRKRVAVMQRMENEKQAELNEMKQTFFTNISHELRTPLTLIISPLAGIIRNEKDNGIRQKLQLINRNAHNLLDMVNQMLDLRRMMVDGDKLQLKRGDIVSFVRNICDEFKELDDKNVTMTFSSAIDNLPMDFDSDKFGKVVNNLLSNAYKFTPDGGYIRLNLDTNADNMFILKVADNGIGISDEDKKLIFNRFYQTDTIQRSSGSGIGLNIVAEYVKMHNGTITVTDNEGGGTVFTIALPIKCAMVDVPFHEESKPKSVEDKRIELLLVDDSADFLEFMVSELEGEYNVTTAVNGVDALAKIHNSRPDIILSDVMMPEMDGNQLCQTIKHDPALADIPIIMLTARLSEENELESRECGADDYITKPFNLDLLLVHIRNIVGRTPIKHAAKLEPIITESEVTSMDEKLVADATAFVEKNLNNPDISVEMMSVEMNMSRIKLYRRLLSVTGKTPSEFIRLIRLRHAEQLLRKSQLTISEIAYQTGFSSQRYFSKCFKDLYGDLPSHYKGKK